MSEPITIPNTKPTNPRSRRRPLVWALVAIGMLATTWGAGAWWVEKSALEDIYDRDAPQRGIERLTGWHFLSFYSNRWNWFKAEGMRKMGDFARVRQYSDSASATGVKPEMAKGPLWLSEASIGLTNSAKEHLGPLMVQYGPHRSEVFASLVQGFLAKGNLQDASQTIRLWREEVEADPQLHYWDGVLATTKYELNRAVASFRKSLELKPNFIDARIELATVLTEQAKSEDAHAEWEWLAQNAPSSGRIITGYARSLLNTGYAEEAATELAKLPNPEKLPAADLALLAETHLEAKQFERAFEQSTLLIERWPDVASYLELLARSEAGRGHGDQSKLLFDKAKRSQNRRPEIDQLLGQLNSDPNNLNLRRNLGELMMAFFDPASGAGYLQAVARSNPNDLRVHELLAIYFRRECKPELALMHEKYLRDHLPPSQPTPPSQP